MALLPPSTALWYPQIVMSYLNNFWITGVLTLSLFLVRLVNRFLYILIIAQLL